MNTTTLYRGKRNYELSNHLGNFKGCWFCEAKPYSLESREQSDSGVNVVISDKRKSFCDEELGVERFEAEVLSGVDYYPFGKMLPDRQYYASNDTSQFINGFNGMRYDHEINQKGRSIDYGARILDVDLGRWLSRDPLEAKYAGASTYSVSGNCPTLYVDFDGKDYGVRIDKEAKTVTIVANVYTLAKDLAEVNEAANYWCHQSGKYQLEVKTVLKRGFLGIGRVVQREYYDINFDINVIPKETSQERDQAYRDDESGFANTYKVLESELYDAGDGRPPKRGATLSDPQISRGSSRMLVGRGNQSLWKTGSHELGHILGIEHWFSGLMMDGSRRKSTDIGITKGNVRAILENAGIGKSKLFYVGSEIDKPSYDEHTGEGKAKATVEGGESIEGKTKVVEK